MIACLVVDNSRRQTGKKGRLARKQWLRQQHTGALCALMSERTVVLEREVVRSSGHCFAELVSDACDGDASSSSPPYPFLHVKWEPRTDQERPRLKRKYRDIVRDSQRQAVVSQCSFWHWFCPWPAWATRVSAGQEIFGGFGGIVAEEDVGSLLQRGNRNLLRVNVSSLERERQGQVKPETEKRSPAKHCGPAGIASAVLGYYVLILLASLWAALSGTDGGLSESESHGRGSCSQVCQVLQGCAWQLLLGLATGCVGKENPQAASLLTCLVSSAALGACQAASLSSQISTLLQLLF